MIDAIDIDREGPGEKKLFKKKRKCYGYKSTDYWWKKYLKQKICGQNETSKSISSQCGRKSDIGISANIVEKNNDAFFIVTIENMLDNESNIDNNAN